ncbi:hypothetical protein WN943_006607 [Citrus x changshan-huyou]
MITEEDGSTLDTEAEYYSHTILADTGEGKVRAQYAGLVWELHNLKTELLLTMKEQSTLPLKIAMFMPHVLVSFGKQRKTTMNVMLHHVSDSSRSSNFYKCLTVKIWRERSSIEIQHRKRWRGPINGIAIPVTPPRCNTHMCIPVFRVISIGFGSDIIHVYVVAKQIVLETLRAPRITDLKCDLKGDVHSPKFSSALGLPSTFTTKCDSRRPIGYLTASTF